MDNSSKSLTFSVVTPSFNQGSFIEQTIQSVLNQNYPDFEHIIIDGGSTDHTLDVLRHYPHIHWISEKDSGQSEALNKGLRMAQGEIIAWINSDDYYEPSIFSFISNHFNSHPEWNILMGDCNLVDSNGKVFQVVVNYPRTYSEIQKFWLPSSIPTQPAIFFRRKLLAEFGFVDERLHYAMDYDLWMRFSRQNTFFHVDRVVANYRFHADAKGGDLSFAVFIPECERVFRRDVHTFDAYYGFYRFEIIQKLRRLKALLSLAHKRKLSH